MRYADELRINVNYNKNQEAYFKMKDFYMRIKKEMWYNSIKGKIVYKISNWSIIDPDWNTINNECCSGDYYYDFLSDFAKADGIHVKYVKGDNNNV